MAHCLKHQQSYSPNTGESCIYCDREIQTTTLAFQNPAYYNTNNEPVGGRYYLTNPNNEKTWVTVDSEGKPIQ